DGDEASALERELALRARLGLEVERLRASAARRLEPALAPSLRLAPGGPRGHALDPRALGAALGAAVGRRGGRPRARAAGARLDADGDAVRGVALEDGSRVAATNVVVAAGVWSGGLGGLAAGRLVPLRPVKGQILRLHDPAGPGLLTRVIRMGPS